MKIGIVHGDPVGAEILRRAVAFLPAHEVVWMSATGSEAVDLCAAATPDLVLLDLMTRDMDGVEITRRIMAVRPCPILIVTTSVNAQAGRVLEALDHGALDAVDAPTAEPGDVRLNANKLLAKIATLSRLIDQPAPAGVLAARSAAPEPVWQPPLVAIGASAGGPAALAVVLGALPRNFQAGVVIVQHVDEQFAPGLSEWLSLYSALAVNVAREGDRPTAGIALLASSSDHLVLKTPERLGYTREPLNYVYRPSVDVFFDSVSRLWRGDVLGVLLTGMGRDGAVGLKAMRSRGHHTIAQDKSTSAVYGMPKAAATLEAAVEILPIERIAERLVSVVSSRMTRAAARHRGPAGAL